MDPRALTTEGQGQYSQSGHPGGLSCGGGRRGVVVRAGRCFRDVSVTHHTHTTECVGELDYDCTAGKKQGWFKWVAQAAILQGLLEPLSEPLSFIACPGASSSASAVSCCASFAPGLKGVAWVMASSTHLSRYLCCRRRAAQRGQEGVETTRSPAHSSQGRPTLAQLDADARAPLSHPGHRQPGGRLGPRGLRQVNDPRMRESETRRSSADGPPPSRSSAAAVDENLLGAVAEPLASSA